MSAFGNGRTEKVVSRQKHMKGHQANKKRIDCLGAICENRNRKTVTTTTKKEVKP